MTVRISKLERANPAVLLGPLVSALEDIDVRHAQAEASWRALLAEALVVTLSDPVSARGVRIAGRIKSTPSCSALVPYTAASSWVPAPASC
jgi:hypothetical protein